MPIKKVSAVRGTESLDLTFAYDTYYLILLNMASIFILIFINFVIWLKAKKNPLLYTYLVTQGLLLVWMVFKIFKTIAPYTELKFVFVVFQYIGISFLGGSFFIFATLYKTGKSPALKLLVLLGIMPVLSLAFLITNSYHHLFYSHFDFWGDSFGPVFYIQQAYNYVLILAGIFLCIKVYRSHFREKRIPAFLFSLAIVIPLIANGIYVFGWFELLFGFSPPCDITPISCNISLMLFALATFRYRFFNDVIIARKTALSSIPDGILLLDRGMRIIDFNETFKNLYESGCLYTKEENSGIKKTTDNPKLFLYDRADFMSKPDEIIDITYEADSGCYYRVIGQPVVQRGITIGYSLRFIDISLKQAILKNMENKNKELLLLNGKLAEQTRICRNLSIARTRNLIAGQAHDVLGHSIVLVISILEVARLSMGKPGFQLKSSLDRAINILNECMKKGAILGYGFTAAGDPGLIDRINNLIEDADNAYVHIELSFSGNIPTMPTRCEKEIYRLCREGITNAMRHGKAEKIDIILRFNSENTVVYIIDNGIGCKKVNKGMGISGIEDRLKLIGGTLSCGSFGSRGFCLRADVPFR